MFSRWIRPLRFNTSSLRSVSLRSLLGRRERRPDDSRQLKVEPLEQRQLLAVLSPTDNMLAGPVEADVAEASYPQPIPPLLPGELGSESLGPYTDWMPQLAADEIPSGDKDDGGKDIEGYTTLVDTGPSSNRVDIVFLGDGYTAAQIDTVYVDHIESMLAHMFDENEAPFPRYKNFFNVHSVNVISDESGADVPPEGIFRNTALDASYYFDGDTERLLFVKNAKANAAFISGLAGAGFTADMKLITVNDTRYGGGGGAYAVWAGGNSAAREVGLHELGHSFSNLADEYHYGDGTQFTGFEPGEPNVTADPTGEKWSHWLGYTDPDFPGMGTIDVYEGARYHEFGLYRPSATSKMKSLGQPFNAVSREAIIQDIYRLVDPLDTWHDNRVTVREQDPMLWVDVIDPAVIDVQWSVDGELVPGAVGETFALADFGYGPGDYAVSARAFDATGWVRTESDLLEQSIQWDVELRLPPIETGVTARQIFYNNSAWDGNTADADPADQAAIATDKFALLPGEKATWANYTNYSRGINGVMVDVSGLAEPDMINEYDFTLKVGNDNDPGNWANAPQPRTITVDPITGQPDMSRISLIWDDGAIANEWLEVTLLASPITGLAANDVFYFGNAIGEAGDAADHALVNAADEIYVRVNQLAPIDLADIDNSYDFNRDRLVNADDQLIARANQTSPLSALSLISAPASGVVAAAPISPAPPLGDQDTETDHIAPPPPSPVGSLWITEINYNPHDATPEELDKLPAVASMDNDEFEFVELYNSGDGEITLENVSFTSSDDNIDFRFGPNDTLGSGEYLIIAKDPAAFARRYGTSLGVDVYGDYGNKKLDNGGGDNLRLKISGQTFVTFTYDDGSGWPSRPDGKGSTVELLNVEYVAGLSVSERADYLDDDANWRASSEIGGSPGRAGDGPLGVVINEVLTHTDPPLYDTIELHNTTSEPIDISGWWLNDTGANFKTYVENRVDRITNPALEKVTYKKFEIPDDTIIPAGGYVTFNATDFDPFGLWNTPGDEYPDGTPDPDRHFSLSGAKGDDVRLLKSDAAGNLTHFVDHVDFPGASWGESFGLVAGTDELAPMIDLTLGPDNVGGASNTTTSPRIGPLIISEIMYSPVDPDLTGPVDPDDLEFIEIYNSSDRVVRFDEPYYIDQNLPGPIPIADPTLSFWAISAGNDYDEEDIQYIYRFPQGMQIAAGEVLVIVPFDPADGANAPKLAKFREVYNINDSVRLVGGLTDKLSNGSETIRLWDRDEEPLDWDWETFGHFYPRLLEDEVKYDDGDDDDATNNWPTSADAGGDSLQRAGLDAWGNYANSWFAATATPGTINFNPNRAPVAGDDTATVDEGGSVVIDVLLNDSDPDDGDQLILPDNDTVIVDGHRPKYGTVTRNEENKLVYVHNGEEPIGPSLTDTFMYRVWDDLPIGERKYDDAVVTITINPTNDAPVVPDKTASVTEAHETTPTNLSTTTVVNGDTTGIGLLWGISDPDHPAGPFTFTLGDQATHGDATVSPDGSFSYTNWGEEYASDEFTYWVKDPDGAMTEGKVVVAVQAIYDHPPELLQQASATVNVVGGTVSELDGGATDLMSIVTDLDFDDELIPSILLLGEDTTDTAHGSVTLTATADWSTSKHELRFEYTHDGSDPSNYDYQDSFSFEVLDNGVGFGNYPASSFTVTININQPGESPPVIDPIGTIYVEEGWTDVVTVTATDPDSSSVTFEISGGDDADDFSIASTGQLTGQLTFDVGPDYELPHDADGDNEYRVQVRAFDGTTWSDPEEVIVAVDPFYDELPVFTSFPPGDLVHVDENTTQVMTLSGEDGDAGQVEQALTFSIADNVGDNGLFSVNPDTGQLQFVAPPDYENPADADGNNQYNVDVQVSDPLHGPTTRVLIVQVDDDNDLPVAEDFTVTVEQDGAAVIDVLAHVSDQEDEDSALTVHPFALNTLQYGSVEWNDVTRLFTYTHNGGGTEMETFQYEVSDSLGAPASAFVTIIVLAGQNPPVIGPIGTDHEVSVYENQTHVATVTATDPDGSPFTLEIHGDDKDQFTIDSGTGELSFINAPDFPDFENPADLDGDNKYSIQVRAIDDTGLSDTEDVIIHVLPVDDDDTESTMVPREGELIGIGEFQIAENLSDVLLVTVHDDDLWGTEKAPLMTFVLSGVDALAFSAETLDEDGVLEFKPRLDLEPQPDYEEPTDAGLDNTYEVTIEVQDIRGIVLSTYDVTIHVLPVNDNPTVIVNDTIEVYEDTEMDLLSTGSSSVLDNDLDADLDEYRWVKLAADSGPEFGSLTLNADGTFLYIHSGDGVFDGDSFRYEVYEGAEATGPSGQGRVDIQIILTNDTPVAEDFSVTVMQGETVELDVLAHASDEEDDYLGVDLTPTEHAMNTLLHGTASWNPSPTSTFSYTHDGNGTEPEFFTYEVHDSGGITATGTVTINVSTTSGTVPEFILPAQDDFDVYINENATNVLAVEAYDPDGLSVDFSVDTTVDDGSQFAITAIDGTHAQLTFIEPPDHENPKDIGNDNEYRVQIRATDVDQQWTTRTLIVHVQAVNEHAPVFQVTAHDAGVDYQDGIITVEENHLGKLLDLTATDDDLPGQILLPGQGVDFYIVDGIDWDDFSIDQEDAVLYFDSPDYENPADADGDNIYYLTLGVWDGYWEATLPLEVHVTPVDDNWTDMQPDTIEVDEGGATDQLSGAPFSYSVLENDTDDDDDEDRRVELHTDVQYGTLELYPDGTFFYIHGGDEPGDHQPANTDQFEYDLYVDDQLWGTATVTIDVTPVNDPPVALDGSASVTEGGTVDIDMAALSWDVDSIITAEPTITAGPAHGTLTWNPSQQTYTYRHNGPGIDDDSFTYEVNDGEYPASGEITINVGPIVQDPPDAEDDQAIVAEGGLVVIDVLANDPVPGTDIVVDVQPLHGSLAVVTPGVFRYTHDDSETPGTDSFTYKITGAGGSFDTAVVTITVDPWINDNVPTAVDGQSITVNKGDTFDGSLQFDDADLPNDVLTVNTTPISGPSHGSLILNADGTFRYTHDGLGIESDAFTYEVQDALDRTVAATVTITVEGDQPSGAVDYRRIDDLDSQAENLFHFTAFRDGIFTALLQADDFGPSTRVELYSGTPGNLQLLASGVGRVDHDQVTAGEPLAVKVVGLESNTDDLLLANLIQIGPSGSEITVFGTAGDDTFIADLGSADVLTINQVDYAINGASSVSFSGQGGSDLADVTGSAGNEVGMLYPRSATLMGTGYQLGLSDVDTIRLYGGGGDDAAWLFDSAGPDTLTATPDYAELSNGDYSIRVESFGSVHAFAGGGYDVAELHGSDGADTFRAEPREASLQGNGFYHRAKRFENVIAYAGGGLDIASMYDSPGDDTFEAWPDEASLQGSTFLNQAMDFSHVVVHGGAGGEDQALLHDSAGNDHFVATPDFGAIYGSGFYNRVSKFAQVVATATTGTDVASLFDSPGDDHFLGTPDESTLSGTNFSNRAEGFDSVHAYATVGGHDTATLIGSAGNDTFVSTDTYGSLSGGDFHNRAKYFEEVYAEAAGGDMDLATLGDSPEDDLLQADGNWARLSNAALDFLYQVSDFDRVEANASNSGDTKSVSDPSSLDFLLEMNDLWG